MHHVADRSGAKLVANADGRVVVVATDDYDIRLFNGDVLNSPSRAATRMKERVAGKCATVNGWRCRLVEEGGPTLYDVLAKCLARRRILTSSRFFGTVSTTFAPSGRTLCPCIPTRLVEQRTKAGARRLDWA